MTPPPSEVARSASWWLLLLSVALMFALATPTLAALGVPYDRPGGSPAVKLHPSTYTLTLAALLGLAGRGNPARVVADVVRRMPLLSIYLATMVFVAVWNVWLHGTSGTAFYVDSLWMPAIAVITLALQPQGRHRLMLWLIVGLLAINASMALAEQAARSSFIPQGVGLEDWVSEIQFRASALLGHPLSNALITASLMPAVAVLPLRASVRCGLVLLLVLSLLAFGGRAALLTSLALYTAAGLLCLTWRALRGAYSYRQWVGSLLVGILGVCAVAGVVAASGLGERIFDNLTWDNSANVRLLAWDALGELDSQEWWLGTSQSRLDAIRLHIGLDPRYEAIENYWLALLIQVGLLGFIPFVLGLFAGVLAIWRVAPVPMRLGIVTFFVVGSGANTLSSKTVAMVLLFLAAQSAAAFVRQPVRPRPGVIRPVRTRPALSPHAVP